MSVAGSGGTTSPTNRAHLSNLADKALSVDASYLYRTHIFFARYLPVNPEHCSESSRLLGHPECQKEAAECARPASSISALAAIQNLQGARKESVVVTIESAADTSGP